MRPKYRQPVLAHRRIVDTPRNPENILCTISGEIYIWTILQTAVCEWTIHNIGYITLNHTFIVWIGFSNSLLVITYKPDGFDMEKVKFLGMMLLNGCCSLECIIYMYLKSIHFGVLL